MGCEKFRAERGSSFGVAGTAPRLFYLTLPEVKKMEEDFPNTRKLAKETGSLFYFTGNPCKHGHVAKRYTSGGACYECEQVKYWANREAKCAHVREYKKKNAKHVLEYNREYRKNNREKDRGWKKAYVERNPEKVAKIRKRYREENKEALSEKARERYLKNRNAMLSYGSWWQKNNPEKVRAKTMRYQAAKLKRTLEFSDHYYKELNDFCISEIYSNAEDLNKKTGITHEVDHIVPLQGKFVSGLHVWYNLQAIPMSENRRKSNKLIFEYIDEEEF